jgi:EAL domain-containing protein (putative c-di-GMP-specific phosphodiesterase class I)
VKPKRVQRAQSRPTPTAPPAPIDWLSVLHLGASDPGHWPASGTASIVDRTLRHVEEPANERNGKADRVVDRSRQNGAVGKHDFRTVFQPIVDLNEQTIVGYEALTRFIDGVAPEPRLAEAMTNGTSLDIELALTQAAIAEASALPPGTWLAVNASSRTLLSTSQFRVIVEAAACSVVVELKEPTTMDADASLRQAVHSLPRNASLGIQNVGLDHASLAIVGKLRPRFIKLDRSVIAGVDADPARQAQISTMVHVASSVSCEVIAAGIETEAELENLYQLGVRFGQGYLLGRPNQLLDAGIHQ